MKREPHTDLVILLFLVLLQHDIIVKDDSGRLCFLLLRYGDCGGSGSGGLLRNSSRPRSRKRSKLCLAFAELIRCGRHKLAKLSDIGACRAVGAATLFRELRLQEFDRSLDNFDLIDDPRGLGGLRT